MATIQSRAYLTSVGAALFDTGDGGVDALLPEYGALGDVNFQLWRDYPGDSGFYFLANFVLASQEQPAIQAILQSAALAGGGTVWDSVTPPGATGTWAAMNAGTAIYVSPLDGQTYNTPKTAVDRAFGDWMVQHTTQQSMQATDTPYTQLVLLKALQALYAAARAANPVQPGSYGNPPVWIPPAQQMGGLADAEALLLAQVSRIEIVNGTLVTAPIVT